MNTLFPLEPAYPQGFFYLPDFITMDEENSLLNFTKTLALHTFQFQGYEAKRKVASFGYDWSFEKQQLAKGKDIPDVFRWLVERAGERLCLMAEAFAELLVTEYPAGSVINWHRDAPPFAVIAGVSLATDCIFKLRPYTEEKSGRRSSLSFPVKRRSFYAMQGEARDAWQHSIAPVKNVRYSITLRTLREGYDL